MLNIIKGFILAVAMGLIGANIAVAAPLGGLGVSNSNAAGDFIKVSRESCVDLRLACEKKDALGERGMGNCRRYKEQCGNKQRHCKQLRWQCLHKEELGAQGMGLCREYREECGRSREY